MKKELNFYLMNYIEKTFANKLKLFCKANENVQSFCENEKNKSFVQQTKQKNARKTSTVHQNINKW